MSDDDSSDDHTSKPGISLLGKLRIAALVVAGIVIIFVVSKNWEDANVDLILIESKMPIAVLIILTFLFGIGVGVLLAYLRPWRKKH
jgi:hypothetical protein